MLVPLGARDAVVSISCNRSVLTGFGKKARNDLRVTTASVTEPDFFSINDISSAYPKGSTGFFTIRSICCMPS